jgi:hypothetical protein
MDKIRLLYILTSGTINSPNNWPWLKLFYKTDNLEIAVLVRNSTPDIKENFNSSMPGYYQIIYFPDEHEIKKYSLADRISLIRKTAVRIKDFNPDVIHVHGCYYTYLVKPLFLLPKNIRLIFNVWGNDFNHLYKNRFKSRIIMNYLFKRADLIWVNWYSMEEDIKNQLPDYQAKIKTILWGIEKEYFIRSSPQTKKKIINYFNLKSSTYVLLYVKGLAESNNQINLVRSLKYLDKDLDYKLIIHFHRDNQIIRNKIEQIILSLNLQSKVILSNYYFEQEELKALIELADLSFSIPSKDQLSRTVLEIILSGTNLIVSDIDPYRRLRDRMKIDLDFVNENNPEDIAKRIKYYIDNRPVADWSEAKEVIQTKYNFNKRKNVFIEVYRSLHNTIS